MKTLYKFQQDTIEKLQYKRKVLLNLDMGLGKTFTSLMLSKRYIEINNKIKHIVVVCEAVKVKDWTKEILDTFENSVLEAFKPYVFIKTGEISVQVVSYNKYRMKTHHMAVWNKRYLNEAILILDECQNVKNVKSKNFTIIQKDTNYIAKLLLLSGDLISTGYIDLAAPYILLDIFKNFWQFRNKYCIREKIWTKTGQVDKIVDYQYVDELLKLDNSIAVHLKQNEVGVELPEQVFQECIAADNGWLKMFKMLKTTRKYNDTYIENISQLIHYSYRLTSGVVNGEQVLENTKLPIIENLINETTDNFVIFYNYNFEKYALLKLAEQLKIHAFQINGETNDYELLKTMKTRHIVLIQYQAGSRGIELQQYNRIIYYSLNWSSELYNQSLARICRIGSNFKTVFYYKIILENSIEEKVNKVLEQRGTYSNKMFVKDYLEGDELPWPEEL